jgi:hypothetical protein
MPSENGSPLGDARAQIFRDGCANRLTTRPRNKGPLQNHYNDRAAAFDESSFKSRARDIASKGA